MGQKVACWKCKGYIKRQMTLLILCRLLQIYTAGPQSTKCAQNNHEEATANVSCGTFRPERWGWGDTLRQSAGSAHQDKPQHNTIIGLANMNTCQRDWAAHKLSQKRSKQCNGVQFSLSPELHDIQAHVKYISSRSIKCVQAIVKWTETLHLSWWTSNSVLWNMGLCWGDSTGNDAQTGH